MNRSIFQIWLLVGWRSFIFSVVALFLVNLDYSCDCFSLRGADNLLKEIKYKGYIFKCSTSIVENNAISSFNYFINNFNADNFNLSISKYYQIIGNNSILFDKNSCYAHPNLFLGRYNSYYFNLQFSSTVFNNNFNLFTKNNNLVGFLKNQFLCDQIYIYDNYLKQQYLNFNNFCYNEAEVYKNNRSNYVQNYLNFNNNKLNDFIKNALKNKNFKI